MMKQKRPFLPNLLDDYDQQLLKNNPETWSARTHLVAYYGLLFMAVLAGICFIRPDDPKSDSTVGYWITFVAIISIIAVVLWLIYLLRFNVFKRYGNITALGRLKTFVLYFISTGIIVLFPYVPPVIETIRADMAYNSDEIVTDANRMNSIVCQLAYDSLPHNWVNDTVVVVDRETDDNFNRLVPEVVKDSTGRSFEVIDTAEYRVRMLSTDSSTKLTDSLYIISTCPSYEFVSDAGAEGHSEIKLLRSVELFNLFIRNYQKPNERNLMAELNGIVKKYDDPDYVNNYYYNDGVISTYGTDWISNTYKTYAVSESIGNITERKYRWDTDNLPALFRIFLYVSFAIALLVFIFRHSTVRTFFLTLLTALLLLILSSLFLAFTRGDSYASLILILFYLLVFTFISFGVFGSRKRNAVTGIAINLFTAIVTFTPLVITFLYYEMNKSYEGVPYDHPLYVNYREMMYINIFYAEVLGFVLFAILLPTFIHRLYRKWYALPEE